MNSPNGQLPLATAPQGRLASPVDERIAAAQRTSLPNAAATNQMSQSLAVPQVSAPVAGTLVAANMGAGRSQTGNASTGTGQAVDNPYYETPGTVLSNPPAQVANPAVAANGLASESRTNGAIPAQQVSFQPRNRGTANERSSLDEQPPEQKTGDSAPIASTLAPAAESKPAIEGYCPVVLRTSGAWAQGDPQFSVRHRGRIYWLSSEEARTEFLRAPDKQSPVLSGYDPMVFLNEGRLVEGSVQWGLLEEVSGTFLFFSSEQLKQEYERNFDNNTRALSIIMQQAGVK
jgi:YHS domain-containing protein